MLSPMFGATLTPSSGTIQATVIIDVSLNIIDADFRTPGGGAILTDSVNSTLLTDFFANAAFGNLVLRGLDSPVQESSFDLTFDRNTISFSGGTFFVTATGALLSGSVNPSIAPYIGPVQFQFAVNSTDVIAETNFFAVTAFLVSAESNNTSEVPEPSTVALCTIAIAGGLSLKRRYKN